LNEAPLIRAGRWYAWAYSGFALIGGALALVVSSGIPPTQPDLAAHYAYVRSIWPELYVAFLLLLAAFLSLIPLAVVLRALFGQGLRSELLYASLVGAGLVGAIWMLIQIGSAQAISRDTAGVSSQTLTAIGASASIWSGVINWIQRGFLLLAGLGTYWVGRAALTQRLLPARLAWLSLVLAATYGLGLASLVARDLGLPLPGAVGSSLVALGALLATAWGLWLGWVLGRAESSR
jgi:hypothetical protein